MFFSVRSTIERKIKELLRRAVRDSDKMSWEEELMAAKTIETYTKILEEKRHED